jgi:hypothetical protein
VVGKVVRSRPPSCANLWAAFCLVTLDDLHSWKVSVLAQTGLSFDLGTSCGV